MLKILILSTLFLGIVFPSFARCGPPDQIDKYLELHRYDKKIIINDEKELIEYCQEHFAWERITESYTKQGIKYLIREI